MVSVLRERNCWVCWWIRARTICYSLVRGTVLNMRHSSIVQLFVIKLVHLKYKHVSAVL